MADRQIILEIVDEAIESGRQFIYNLRFDGQLLATNEPLSLVQSDLMRDIGEAYGSLFIASPLPPSGSPRAEALLAGAKIKAMGISLFEAWLAPHWSRLASDPGDRRILIIASALPDILNLPWELLRPPDQDDICTDLGWGIRRMPWANRQVSPVSHLTEGPLRVLFVACSPRGRPELDYENEEEQLSRALVNGIRLDIATLGTFKELANRLEEFEPHIVHLSGHGTISEGGAAFAFEDAAGDSDMRSAKALADIFAGSGVRCVFVSGCHTSSAPARDGAVGLCQAIVAEGIPMAVGWEASIADGVAIVLAERFYRSAALGKPLDYALAQARREARTAMGDQSDASWSLAALYATTADVRLLDKSLPAKKRPASSREFERLPKMWEAHTPHLLGRRRELQAVLPKLQDGTLRGIVLSGMGGAGKSALATRLARKLEADTGLTPVVLKGERGAPLAAESILATCADALLVAGRADAHQRASDKRLSVEQRLRVVVEDLSDGFVIVIDDFQTALDEPTRAILDTQIADFYGRMLDIIGGSRVIITSRYLPGTIDPLPDHIANVSLGEFTDSAFLKFMFREATVKQRYQLDLSRRNILAFIRDRLGGLPAIARQIRQELTGWDPDQLKIDIDNMRGGAPAIAGRRPLPELETKHDDFCTLLAINRHHGRLSAGDKKILLYLAIHDGPISAAGLAALSGTTVDDSAAALTAFRGAALVHDGPQQNSRTPSIYGTLRRWLMTGGRCSAAELTSAYRAAADYLIDLEHQKSGGTLARADFGMLMTARAHYLACNAMEQARDITYRISEILLKRSDYEEIERLNLELMKPGPMGEPPHPDPATWIARSYIDRPDYKKALEWYNRALELSENHAIERGHALQGIGTIQLRRREFNEARKTLMDALAIQKTVDDVLGQGLTWHQLGSASLEQMDYEVARSDFSTAQELIAVFRGAPMSMQYPIRLEQAQEVDQALSHQLGSIELEEGHLDEARRLLQSARTLARARDDRRAEAAAIHQLGRVDAKAWSTGKGGDLAKARTMLGEALAIRWSIRDRAGEILSFRRLGQIAALFGRTDLELDMTIISYAIGKAIDHDTRGDLAAIDAKATALNITPEQLQARIDDLEQRSLSDRGQGTLRRLYASPVPPAP